MAAESWFLSAVCVRHRAHRGRHQLGEILQDLRGGGGRIAAPSWRQSEPAPRHRAGRSWPRCLCALANMRALKGSIIATGIAEACRLRHSWRCHLPVASTTTRREVEAREPALELADALARVGHPQPPRRRPDADVEPVLAHIDSYARLGLGLLFGRFLALHAGRAPYHLLRTRAEGRTDHAHPRCRHPRGRGPARPCRGRRPPASTHLTACADRPSQHARLIDMNAPLSLYRVSDGPAKKTDLVFIHGLQGSAAQTWSATADRSSFGRLGSQPMPTCGTQYPADVCCWWAAAGADMALPERARSVADLICQS